MRRVNKRLSLHISQKYSSSHLMSSLLASRNENIDSVRNFLNPTLKFFLPDPLIFNDMGKGVERLISAIKNKEKISVLGDYDVDGLSSISLIKKYFDYLKVDIFSYIPDRIKEGYGPNKKSIDKIKLKKTSLLIMVDCGTTAVESVLHANKAGIDVIIIDHHKTSSELPNAFAIINPNILNNKSKYNYLCAAGLTYIFLIFLHKSLLKINSYKNIKNLNLLNFLDLVALATICDVVPLIDLNRAFVKQGLKVLALRNNIGLKALADISKLNKKPDENDLGFFYGPRLNAGGRVGKSYVGEKLLNVKENTEAELLVKQLNTFNYQRKLIEEKVFTESLKQINNTTMLKKTLVLYKDEWHEGVLGIVASRIKEKFNKPTFVLSNNKNILKGSGRSITGIDIGSFINKAKEKKIIISGGGHQMAGGLSLEKNSLDDFKELFEEYVLNNSRQKDFNNILNIDGLLSIKGINDELIDVVNKIAPYGSGNPRPIFAIKNVKIIKPKLVGESKNHLSFIISDKSGKSIKAIIFYSSENLLGQTILNSYRNKLFLLAGYVKREQWKNKNYFEIIIEDGVVSDDII